MNHSACATHLGAVQPRPCLAWCAGSYVSKQPLWNLPNTTSCPFQAVTNVAGARVGHTRVLKWRRVAPWPNGLEASTKGGHSPCNKTPPSRQEAHSTPHAKRKAMRARHAVAHTSQKQCPVCTKPHSFLAIECMQGYVAQASFWCTTFSS
jgi:hypothetical protein